MTSANTPNCIELAGENKAYYWLSLISRKFCLTRFADAEKAQASSDQIYQLFLDYLEQEDFIGADMARKFLQMGYTRARRYANHKGGKKYDGPVPADKKGLSGAHGRSELPRSHEDPVKAAAAKIFKQKWDDAKNHPEYIRQKEKFQAFIQQQITG